VYVQPVPASGAVYQAPKQQLDFQPVWSPDGRELFYVPSAASGRIAAARVSTQSGVTFGAPQILPARVTAARTSNEPRAFDILPDGRFIGLIGSGSDTLAAIELRLVLNWFEELKQRVPAK
jgi:Tol biopolymer transport system component